MCYEKWVSLLHTPCEEGHEGIVQLLLSKGADINAGTKDGASPLNKPCRKEHHSTVQLMDMKTL